MYIYACKSKLLCQALNWLKLLRSKLFGGKRAFRDQLRIKSKINGFNMLDFDDYW